ncbi:MAG: hypothetical protein G01um101419_699 [Parcubacteria group bacterium Gr01-1014_19]|nr:MAG: hypothetical protein G01um101419_699 [Parcubacteria group bacterium Gr01-1014_19]
MNPKEIAKVLAGLGAKSGKGNANAEILMKFLGIGGNEDEKAYDPTVERVGDKIIIPEGANLPDVIDALQRQYDFEEQETEIHITIPVAPWDGASALQKAIKSELGLFNQMGDGWDGKAHQIDVEVELGKTIQVPWGTFQLPGMEGATVKTDTGFEDGRIVFLCNIVCKRRFEQRIRRLLDVVRKIAMKESLHRGKAFSISFLDSLGRAEAMPKPKFFELTKDVPIFREDLQNSIDRNVLIPIRYAKERKEQGRSLKRGILFAGEYGVGKTLLASYIARAATEAGWTFIYVRNPAELPQALKWAVQYQPVVVFVEDIDRVAGIDRNTEVNVLLNQLDGIDGKATEIMTVLTSNHADKINPAMRRPGRIDLVVSVLPPDAETVKKMVRIFAGGSLEEGTDLTGVGEVLTGEIPARIKEAVNRAELEATRRTGDVKSKITGADLEAVAREVKTECDLFNNKMSTNTQDASTLAEGFAQAGAVMKQVVQNAKQAAGK